jgi:hypothetical protein
VPEVWRKLAGVPVPGYRRWWMGAPGASGLWCYRWEGMAERDFRCGGFTRLGTLFAARRAYYREFGPSTQQQPSDQKRGKGNG